jgi:hypothetical protein
LLAPIIGEFANDEAAIGFIPPRAGRLGELIRKGAYPAPLHCEIHVGAQDWQSRPSSVIEFADAIGAKVSIVENAGHSLPQEYVRKALDVWMTPAE